MPVGEDDLGEDARVVLDAAVRKSRVGGREVERAHRIHAEHDRGDGLEPRLDPHPVRERCDRLGAEVERETGVDRVVGEEGRLRERDPARVRVLERVDVPVVRADERSRQVLGRVGVDLPLHGLRQDEQLEGRPRLPLTVDREVVRDPLAGLGDRHRADLAGLRIDRDDRARRVALAAERAEDRMRRVGLHLRVERRVDPEAAPADALGAVLVHELIRDEVGQIGLAGKPRRRARIEAERAAECSAIAGLRDRARLEHRA